MAPPPFAADEAGYLELDLEDHLSTTSEHSDDDDEMMLHMSGRRSTSPSHALTQQRKRRVAEQTPCELHVALTSLFNRPREHREYREASGPAERPVSPPLRPETPAELLRKHQKRRVALSSKSPRSLLELLAAEAEPNGPTPRCSPKNRPKPSPIGGPLSFPHMCLPHGPPLPPPALRAIESAFQGFHLEGEFRKKPRLDGPAAGCGGLEPAPMEFSS
eukprot:tig00020553_g10566.t1